MAADERLGLLVIDKPRGITSHTAVRRCARALGIKKAGHAGTLDPMASGVLLIGLGRATRLLEYVQAEDKEYRAVIRLGEERDTLDREGELLARSDVPELTEERIREVLASFVGVISQTPPAFSAIKIGGERSYKKARRGEPVEMPSREVTIKKLDLVSWKSPELTVEVACSKGTYIRSLARDVGKRLGAAGCLYELERTASSGHSVSEAVDLDTLAAEGNECWKRVLDPKCMVAGLVAIELDAGEAEKFVHGTEVELVAKREDGTAAVFDPGGRLLGIGVVAGERLKPHKVLFVG